MVGLVRVNFNAVHHEEIEMSIIAFKKAAQVVLKKTGLWCSECNTWFSSKASTKDELKWGVNCGDVLFMDPFYIKITRLHCSKCNHLMSEKRELSNREVE